MLEIPWDVVDQTTTHEFAEARHASEAARRFGKCCELPTGEVTDEILTHLHAAAASIEQTTYQQAILDIQDARNGAFRQVKSVWGVSEILLAYLRANAIDGWVYTDTTKSAHPQPVLVTDIESGAGGYKLTTAITYDPGFADTVSPIRGGCGDFSASFRPGTPATLLRRLGVQKETPALREAYLHSEKQLIAVLAAGPGVRGTVTGDIHNDEKRKDGYATKPVSQKVTCRPVITDNRTTIDFLEDDDPRADAPALVPGDPDLSRMPNLLYLEVFDTISHTARATHIDDLTVHVYQDVREKIVLPAAHRRLLDMLAFDTGHAADLLEERTAGNTVMAAGPPGCGKTLTAQIYAEVLHKPLYSVDAGVILKGGINGVHNQVATIFERCRRWDAVLLLDEVDVIVGRRDHHIDRNTLTAAFLRVMETFDRLTFMTTNRLDDVDDAILSRCTAILAYEPPTGDQARKVWKILAELHKTDLPEDLLDHLLETFPTASPRDMRQMLRLAVQTATYDKTPLTIDTFRAVAPFRAIADRTATAPAPRTLQGAS